MVFRMMSAAILTRRSCFRCFGPSTHLLYQSAHRRFVLMQPTEVRPHSLIRLRMSSNFPTALVEKPRRNKTRKKRTAKVVAQPEVLIGESRCSNKKISGSNDETTGKLKPAGNVDQDVQEPPSDVIPSKSSRRRKASKRKSGKVKKDANVRSNTAKANLSFAKPDQRLVVRRKKNGVHDVTDWTGLTRARKSRMSFMWEKGMLVFLDEKVTKQTIVRSGKTETALLTESSPDEECICQRKEHENDYSYRRRRRSRTRPWTGLTAERKRRLPFTHQGDLKLFSDLWESTFNANVSSSLQSPLHPVQRASIIFASAKAHGWSLPFRISDATLISFIEAVMREAEENKLVSEISSNGADVACEVLFRCLDIFDVRPSTTVLLAVLRSSLRDTVVERRSERALSVFRFARGLQLLPTAEFLYECFRGCVLGLDVEAAAMMMAYAFQLDLCRDVKASETGPLRIDYYNGVMYAALLIQDFNTLSVAHDELMRQELQPNTMTESIFLSMSFERGDERTAEILLGAMRKKQPFLEDVVFASMLRSAGQKRDTASVLGLYREFEKQRTLGTGLMQNIPYQGANASWSTRASASARADPTFSVFQALRTCGAAEESFEHLHYLQKKYRCTPPRSLYAMVIETCWKGGRLDLAQKLRIEMESALMPKSKKKAR